MNKISFKCMDKRENKTWTGTLTIISKSKNKIEMVVTGRGSSFHAIIDSYEYGNYLCIPSWQTGCELASYEDIFWNWEQINRCVGSVDAITLSTAIKTIGKKLRAVE